MTTRHFQHLFGHFRRCALQVWSFIVFAAVSGYLTSVVPIWSGYAIDAGLHGNNRLLHCDIGVVCAAAFALALSSYLQAHATASFSRALSIQVSSELIAQTACVRYCDIANQSDGELLTLFHADLDTITQSMSSAVLPALSWLINLGMFLGAIACVNVRLAALTVVLVPIWVVTLRVTGGIIQKAYADIRVVYVKREQFQIENLVRSGLLMSRLWNRHAEQKMEFLTLIHSEQSAFRRISLAGSASSAIVAASLSLGSSVFLIVGFQMIDSHSISVGELTAFLAVQASMFYPLQVILRLKQTFHVLSVALTRVMSFLDRPREETGCMLGSGDGTVKLVNFRVSSSPMRLGSNLTILRGEHVAIMGESGSGKSTFCLSIAGMINERLSGDLVFEGVDVREWNLMALRESMTILPQAYAFPHGSIRDAVCGRGVNVPESEVGDVLDAVGLGEVLDDLPGGMHANPSDIGRQLSGGERQRVALASALLRRRALNIYDEATSALDRDAEGAMIALVRKRLRGSSILWITHRLDAAQRFDRIIEFRDGMIAEGRSRELFV